MTPLGGAARPAAARRERQLQAIWRAQLAGVGWSANARPADGPFGGHEAVSVRAPRMFDNVQTLSFGMDMLIISLAPLIALGLERYCREGHEHG